ncbi:MAG TPA: hypothetical protein VF274_11190 [Alphaproteobacteria bacterium]|jgi:aminoglycoside phosphotransferase family enzyme
MTDQPGANDPSPSAELPLGDKVDFLGRPEAYPEPTRRVEPVETHMSWVFLTDAYAYKMKKPVRYAYLDYSTLERRRRMCGEELRLNRRLASWVYLGIVALVCDDRGRLALSEPGDKRAGTIVEWLVKMVRLPAECLLNQAIGREAVNDLDAQRTAVHLAEFFARAEPVRMPIASHIRRLGMAIGANARDIDAAGTPSRRYASVVRALHGFLDERSALLETRLARGRLVEGHGDLRPEHVFLGAPPAIIDCLEFDRALRLADPLAELAFLTMECERLGAAKWGELFLEIYLERAADDAPEELMAFYMAERALLRARLALGHLHDGVAREPKRWLDQADQYLDLANGYVSRL